MSADDGLDDYMQALLDAPAGAPPCADPAPDPSPPHADDARPDPAHAAAGPDPAAPAEATADDELEAAFEAAQVLPTAAPAVDDDDLEAAFEAALVLPVPLPPADPCAASPAAAAVAPVQAVAATAAPARRRASDRAERWLLLRVGGQRHALELLKVQEVLRVPPVQRLRGAGNGMLGVMNLRGQIVPVLDLGAWLYGGPCATDAGSRVVVLEEHGQTLGVLVEDVTDVATLAESAMESTAIVGVGGACEAFRGVARVAGAPVVLIDAGRLLAL